ncbi:hypothetical protein EN745_07945 [Mesorhizobium sp. M4A.F.Ca.ET.022.05.2.1]|uniref:amidase family protein n=1 Tax=Mesorhizobium sp. M4A.F.Ca.ET.022.05.2.1 TaxID=2496653 RepID=UPI000FCC09A7|nr:amidase family protein [Mesorhizobium sp. M4A.F.Ca.ET.022.05.2.1]RVC68559.1 hypothetical protein EN766_30215 [Mesorhizobium sp. M2A.F.Ca.ET.046.02.1.1]RVC82051.1 hypothetical protein EN745_07945 [Mesorhizobium sp. M4A.F.Ca.ET.022.05.2.1]TIU42965.1 MAG: hypothetical protein E5W28_00105 [Mesorhizobium sp.]TIW59665.1 MAG: hypothetical protein E5V48_16925 [Mesorhizobium sp.]
MRCWIEYQPSYNAFVTLNPYALDVAKAINNRLGFGEKLGSLAGVPIVIKEPIDIAGELTSSHATYAPVVARLRAAGAILLGKTNMPTLGESGTDANTSWGGPTYNAVNRAYDMVRESNKLK